ncbi:MAG TPA: hypothetical protein VK176_01980 [Phycisphaerales bacterium]|nr:hypothetical protein [Phycisphaerales bacterium]
MLFAFAALLFPSPWSDWRRMTVGPRSEFFSPLFGVTAVLRPDGIEVIAPWDPDAPGSDGDLWTRAANGEIKLVSVSYLPRRTLHGMLGITQEIMDRKLTFYEVLNDEQSKAVQEAVLQRLEIEPAGTQYREWAAEIREFDRLYGGTRTCILVWGYVWNAMFAVAAMIGLGGGLDAAMHGPGWLRAYRRKKRIKQGRCARCGYSVVGITGACPECGEPRQDA